jgi:LemA protein
MRRFAPLLLAIALPACGINSVPAAQENARARWADVEAAYQRRANLIPNLEATVKGAAASERQILSEVINARARATQVQLNPGDLGDPAKVQAFAAAQGQLNGSIGRLIANQEAYPTLRSQEGFRDLMTQLEGTENRITIAIRDYNEAVQAYNTRIRTFPDAIGARVIHGAEPLVPYRATTPGAENAPRVNFG